MSNRPENLLPPFLVNHIANNDPLSAEEEQELASIIQDTTSSEETRVKCRNRLAIANLRFAISTLRAYDTTGLNLDYEDMFQYAFEGLLDAANTFKPGYGRFCTYAMYCIQNKTSPAVQKNMYCIKLSGTTQKKVEEVIHVAEKTSQIQKRTVDPLEVAAQCGYSPDEIEVGLNATAYVPMDDANLETYDTIEDDTIKHQMQEVKKILSPYEYDLIARYYGIGCEKQTSARIGNEYAVSGQRIRVLIKNAEQKLSETMNPRRDTDGCRGDHR